MSELTFRSLELRPADRRMFFWFEAGLDGKREIRGTDTVIPGRTGHRARNRVADRRIIPLLGFIGGQGVTEALARQDYRALMDALQPVLDETLAPSPLVAFPPVEGLTTSRTINVRVLGTEEVEFIAGYSKRIRVQLECIDSPPDWT